MLSFTKLPSFLCSALLLLMTFQGIAQCPDTCVPMLQESFAYTANEGLNGELGGTGFSDSWTVQDGNETVPGYQTSSGSLSFADLQSTGNHASGGYVYLTAGRLLDVSPSGPFSSYLTNGNIGLAGTNLFFSALLRKENDNGQTLSLSLHQSTVDWYVGSTQLSVGYYGAVSENNGIRYWTLRVGDQYFQTTTPVQIGSTTLVVVEIQFGNNDQHNINVWVNPSSIGGTAPTPHLSQTITQSLSFNALGFYGGNDIGQSSIDEIRLAANYQCATPNAMTPVNQLPTATFTSSTTSGQVPFTVNFNSSASSDPDGTIVSYQWQFGDGSTSTVANPTFTFEHVGVMPVVLTVTDNCGSQASQQLTILAQNSLGETPCGSSVSLLNLATQGNADGSFSFDSNYGNNFSLSDGSNSYSSTNNSYQNLPVGDYTFTISGDNGCQETFNLSMPLDNQSVNGWSPDLCDMQMGINLDDLPYWNKIRAFKDLKRSSSEFFTGDVAPGGPWDTQTMNEVPVDSEGYPLQIPYTTSAGEQLVRCVISANGSMRLGDYIFLYDGEGVLSLYGNIDITNNTPGRIEFSVTGEGNIWFHLDASTIGNHVRNIRIIRTEQEANFQTEAFYEVFLDKVNAFSTLRFMDWGHTNNSNLVNWSDRIAPAYHTQGAERGIAYEYMIDLANRLEKDVWVCVPHQANADYITQMAQLFRDNLNSNLKIYIEYSNEVWNWQFAQAHWVNANGPAHLHQPRKYAERCRIVFEAWHDVFAGQTDRVKRVLGTQGTYPWIGEQAMAQLHGEFDYLSPTWYFGYSGSDCESSLDASSTAQEVLDCALNNWRSHTGEIRQDYHNARLYGKEVIEYEGGQHMTSNPIMVPFQQAVYDAQIDPAIKDVYNEVLDSIRLWGSRLAVAFTLAGERESIYGSWGALENINQDPSLTYAPKWEVLNENIHCYSPPVLVLLPVELSAFELRKEDCQLTISWQTELEQNSSHFEVQRSENGVDFTSIETVAAAGHSIQTTSYQVKEDAVKRKGLFYYRLKQIDFDGQVEYSEVKAIQVDCNSPFELQVFPNPANNLVNIQWSDYHGEGEFLLTDLLGKVHLTHAFSATDSVSNLQLDLKDLAAGIYYLNLQGRSAESVKVVVQR